MPEDAQCHAKHAENAASVHNTCLHKIVCYLQRMFNRNLKLKQQVNKLNALQLGACSKIKVFTVLFEFFSRFAKIRTFDFRKVVRQHSEGVMGSITWRLLEI